MSAIKEATETSVVKVHTDESNVRANSPTNSLLPSFAAISGAAATGFLHGYDLNDRPLVTGLAQLPGEVVGAHTTVPLTLAMIGAKVVVLFEQGNFYSPIIVGVIQNSALATLKDESSNQQKSSQLSIQADDDRFIVSAEREIVLRCGESSITLTRAGKVIIKGSYILSRATGYNKIKGAAIDIN